jgi:hypothetical protein
MSLQKNGSLAVFRRFSPLLLYCASGISKPDQGLTGAGWVAPFLHRIKTAKTGGVGL